LPAGMGNYDLPSHRIALPKTRLLCHKCIVLKALRQLFLAQALAVALCSPASGVVFENRSAELGVSGGDEACWFDFNNDGWVDICAGGKVFRNDGGTGFTHFADTGPSVAADFDNDGFVDLYSWGNRQIYRNDGGTGFTAIVMPALPAGGSIGACWGDFDGDGFVDLYVGGYESWPSETYADFILTNRGGTSFELTWSEVRYRARGITACDFDRDGDLDVYVSNYRLQPNILWLNQGDSTFRDATGEFNAVATDPGFGGGHSIGSAFGDFNDDGHIDLFAGNFAHDDNRGDQPESRWLRNSGAGGSYHFEDLGQRGVFYQESYSSPTAGDYDNDGDLDLFFTTIYGVASFGRPNNAVMFRNDGGFNFGDASGETSLGGLPPTYQAAFGDFDNDGDLDLMTAGALFENKGGTAHGWLKVKLLGDGGKVNRSAIGAQVRIALPGGKVLTRQVEAGVGQGNQNELTLHFGLGAYHDPVDLEIFWPDGTTQNVAGITADQSITISREPLAQIVSPTGPVALEVGSGLLLVGEAAEGDVTVNWSLASAPEGGSAEFADVAAATTAVQFSVPGEYKIRLSGEKDGLTTIDEFVATVWPDGPRARPVGWWKLDEGSGSTAADASGYGHIGRRTGYADAGDGWLADGQRSGALAFQPADSEFVDLGDHVATFSHLDAGTLAAWFRTDTAGERTIFSLSSTGGDSELRLYMVDGHLQFHVRIDPESDPGPIRSPLPSDDSQWHHAAVSCDSFGVATLYLDGRPVAYGRQPFMSAIEGADRMAIGRSAIAGAGSHYFGGEIDDLRVYPRALTVAEITGLGVATGDHDAAPLIVLPGEHLTVPGIIFPLSALEPFVDGGSVARWEREATFTHQNHRSGDVRFPQRGSYVLRVFAEDEKATAFRDFPIECLGMLASSPAYFAVADVALPHQSGAHEIELFPIFHSPNYWDPFLQFSVTVAPGGEDLFESVAIWAGGRLILQPAPGAQGETQLTVRAQDPDGNVTEVTFAVSVANSAPLVSDLELRVDENSPGGTAVGQVAAIDLDGDSFRFHIVGGNHADAFVIDADSGELSVRNPDAIDFESNPNFDLQVAATDSRHPAYDRPAHITIHVTDLAEPPIVRTARFTVLDNAVEATAVGRVSGDDPDGGALTFSIADGDPGGVFAIDPTSGELTLVTPAGLAGRASFELRVRAADPSNATGAATVTVLPVSALIAEGAPARWTVPTDASQDDTWQQLVYDDSTWAQAPMGIGYDTGPEYVPLIATDIDAQMREKNTSVYLRLKFDVADPGLIGPLILQMRYDDGFLAYLNGRLVAGQNGVDEPDWRSVASGQHPDSEAKLFEEFDLGSASELLVDGENILAIHGLNHLLSSSDFLMSAQLLAAPRSPGIELVLERSPVRWRVPVDGSEDALWRGAEFDNAAWTGSPMGLGYDTGPDYLPHIGSNLAATMQGQNTSVYLRARFDVSQPSQLSDLCLRMKYDDGFIAYLNGVQVAAANAPAVGVADWQSAAPTTHDDLQAVRFNDFPLVGSGADLLSIGENVLAIHGLNADLTSSDFLLSAELVAEVAGPPPASGPVSLHNEGVFQSGRDSVTVACEVGAIGGATAHLFAAWARGDHGPVAGAWPNRAFVGVVDGIGLFSTRLLGLEPDTSYVVRFYAERPGTGESDGWSAAVGFSTAAHRPSELVSEIGDPVRALVPNSEDDAEGWRENDFNLDESRWLGGESGTGYDTGIDGFTGLFGLDLKDSMQRVNPSVYLRFPFLIGDPAGVDSLTLRMKYDDGFVAYLNGTEIARANAPEVPGWNSSAARAHADEEAVTFVDLDVSPFIGVLLPGANTLAVHGMNSSVGGSDFLIVPELVATGDSGEISPFDGWVFERGFFGSDAIPDADPDRNGKSNLEDFAAIGAVGLTPLGGGQLGLSYQRRAGLGYEAQVSGDLANWFPIDPADFTTTPVGDDDFELASAQTSLAGGWSGRAFVRFVISVSGDEPGVPVVQLVGEDSLARAHVPDAPVTGWADPGFDDRAWQGGVLGAGYELGAGYADLIGLDVEAAMVGANTSVYVRTPFAIADPGGIESLVLRMKYDDGFVAYLNGIRVAAANAALGSSLSWDSAATTSHDDGLALQFEDFDITNYLGALIPGENVLAIQGLNVGLTSSDLLVLPELVATGDPGQLAPYDAWAIAFGLSGSSADPDADPDRDGLKNYAEFALVGSPTVPDRNLTATRVKLSTDGTSLEFSYRRRIDAPLEYAVEMSPDLLSWTAAEALETEVNPAAGGGAELVSVQVAIPNSDARFMRLSIR
jgi:hypothetical protein